MTCIVYHNPGLHVVYPNPASGLTIEEVAAKDVAGILSREIVIYNPEGEN